MISDGVVLFPFYSRVELDQRTGSAVENCRAIGDAVYILKTCAFDWMADIVSPSGPCIYAYISGASSRIRYCKSTEEVRLDSTSDCRCCPCCQLRPLRWTAPSNIPASTLDCLYKGQYVARPIHFKWASPFLYLTLFYNNVRHVVKNKTVYDTLHYILARLWQLLHVQAIQFDCCIVVWKSAARQL